MLLKVIDNFLTEINLRFTTAHRSSQMNFMTDPTLLGALVYR